MVVMLRQSALAQQLSLLTAPAKSKMADAAQAASRRKTCPIGSAPLQLKNTPPSLHDR